MNKDIELLSPAGDINSFYSAVMYGANAVYLALQSFGMRTASKNFDLCELEQAVNYAHNNNVKVYLTINTLPHNDEIDLLPEIVKAADNIGVDAFIIGDIGIVSIVSKLNIKAQIHASVQTGIVNYQTANALHDMGASRVVLARELTLTEIADIRAKCHPELELETFVHGSMCMAFSGRCLLSNYLTGRDANKGDCAQPCRWKYNLIEEKRPDELFEITEDSTGTYILNANDLCMIEHLEAISNAGVVSFKIEGRAKSSYYTSVVTNAYSAAINHYKNNAGQPLTSWILDELEKVSHRVYSTGFYFGRPTGSQTYETSGYIRDYTVVAVVTGYEDGKLLLTQRNKFYLNDELDCLEPNNKSFKFTVNKLFNEHGEPMESAYQANKPIMIGFDRPLAVGSLFRKKL